MSGNDCDVEGRSRVDEGAGVSLRVSVECRSGLQFLRIDVWGLSQRDMIGSEY